jgi:hypothetical protein
MMFVLTWMLYYYFCLAPPLLSRDILNRLCVQAVFSASMTATSREPLPLPEGCAVEDCDYPAKAVEQSGMADWHSPPR